MEEKGISVELVKLNRIASDLFPHALASLQKTRRMLMAEEVCAAGCVGELLLQQAAEQGITLKAAKLLNLGEGIVAHGTRTELLRDHGLDAASIADAAERLCAEGKQ